jgi:hypothetical protein
LSAGREARAAHDADPPRRRHGAARQQAGHTVAAGVVAAIVIALNLFLLAGLVL